MPELNEHIRKLRSDYSHMELIESEVNKDPFKQFEAWLKEALEAEIIEPHAMTLSTANKNGQPASRIVLLREVNEIGFIFYTNYNSDKGRQIAENPKASLNFFWPQIERQLCVEGILEKVNETVSDSYFQSRPRESKIGAWVSEQSSVIKNRDLLEEKFIELSGKYPGEDVPRPPHWGGYLLKPTAIEFWQGRPSRLHDRIQYVLSEKKWLIQRLSP